MNLKKLEEEQLKLSKKLLIEDDFSDLNTIAGCDIAYTKNRMIAVMAVMDFKTMRLLETKHIITTPSIPYIASFLAYREAPAIIETFNLLENRPDLLMCDCNGILHPRRMGCASHLGLVLDLPTVGVAKKLLCGTIDGSKVHMDNEPRAHVFHTREHAKPIFISPGHRISLDTSLEIVKKCLTQGNKLPEPTKIAHKVAVKKKRELKENQTGD